jgi:hypothetical protein
MTTLDAVSRYGCHAAVFAQVALRRPAFVLMLALGALTGLTALASAAVISIQPGLTAAASRGDASPPVLRLTGMIEAGDAERLRTILAAIRARSTARAGAAMATIELASLGGDVYEGFKLGYLLREFDVAAMVRSGDVCMSSCALAFLGGTASHKDSRFVSARTIEVGGAVGFHNFFLNTNNAVNREAASPQEGILKGFNQARGAASTLVRYIKTMGVDASFVARLLGRPSEEWEYIDVAGEFIDFTTCPKDLRRVVPAPLQRAINICINATGADVARDKIPDAHALTAAEFRRMLLDHIQRNIEANSTRGPLAPQLSRASRDAKTLDAVYSELRSSGVPLPEIIGPAFVVSGIGAGEYELECHLTVAKDDSGRFDLVLSGPMGLARALQMPPRSCPHIFAFDREDMLNPRR